MADDGLMREVDEDLRRERMQRLWAQYRAPFLTVVVVLLLVLVGGSMWQDYQSKKAGLAMQQLDAGIALMKTDAAKAAEQFAALAKTSKGELNDIARLWQGRAQQEAKQQEKAQAIFADLAKSPAGNDLLWRDMACLRLMALAVDVPAPCVADAASPLQSQRLEWHAADLWSRGKKDEAKTLLEKLYNDAQAPQSQRDRVARLLGALDAGAN